MNVTVESILEAADSFERNDEGKIIARSQNNIRHALKKLNIGVSYNTFDDRMLINGSDLLDDAAIERLWLLIDQEYKFLPAKDFFFTVVRDTARQNSFHPVKDYLNNLKWDGVPRISKWLITYGGAKDTAYVRAVGELMLVAAVRRVRQPGCKFDEMVVFESPQGEAEKSSAMSILAVNPDWFSDDLPLGAPSKIVIEQLRGRWIVEAAELNGMRKADIEHLKSMLSRQVDRARLSYDRMLTEYKRQCIIVGTTNNNSYLRDQTGNRRYWPVEIVAFDLDALKRDRDQLWAEAAAREAQGASIRLDRSLWSSAENEQTERTVEDPWIAVLDKALGDLEGKILAVDVWEIVGVPSDRRTQEHNSRLGTAMHATGWKREKLRFGGKRPEWCYTRGDKTKRIQVPL